jgi:hypothetical protein
MKASQLWKAILHVPTQYSLDVGKTRAKSPTHTTSKGLLEVLHCTVLSYPNTYIIMQESTDQAEASSVKNQQVSNASHLPTLFSFLIPNTLLESEDPCGMNLQNSRDNDEVAPMHIPSDTITIQEPNEDDDASISTVNRPVTVRRKAAKRTLPWDLAAGELDLVSPSQAEEIPARKKQRLEEPLLATIDEAASKTAAHDTAESLTASPDVSIGFLPPPSPAGDDDDDVNADPVTDAQPNVVATRATGPRWTTGEVAQLTCAVANTPKKKWGNQYNQYKTGWDAVAALVPGQTKKVCYDRWIVLKDAVQTHGGKDCVAISALVPLRRKKQSGRTGKWTPDEDNKLKDAVRTHGGKDWDAISALVPGRPRSQCYDRWRNVLDPNIDQANGRMGKWAEDEDSKLKDALQTHGGKNWVVIAALVPGRTKRQCRDRWKKHMDPNRTKHSPRKRTLHSQERACFVVGPSPPLTHEEFMAPRGPSTRYSTFSVGEDGTMAWMPTSTRQMDVWVNGQKTKTSS